MLLVWIVGFVWNAKRNNSSQWTLLCGCTRTGKQTAYSSKVMKINLSLEGKSQIDVSNVFKGLKPRWETPAYPHWREATLMSAMWEKFQTHKVFLPVPTGQKPYQHFHSPVETVHWLERINQTFVAASTTKYTHRFRRDRCCRSSSRFQDSKIQSVYCHVHKEKKFLCTIKFFLCCPHTDTGYYVQIR